MQHSQGGAFVSGVAPKTKKALRDALKERPRDVTLESTSAFPGQYSGPAAELPGNVSFVVVGPDPYTRRDWFARVFRHPKTGVLRVE